MEDECRNNQTKENADDPVANIVEVGVRRVSLKEAVIEGKGNLQTGVSDLFGSRGDPDSERRDERNQEEKRGERRHMREEEEGRAKGELSANDAADGSKKGCAKCRPSAFEHDESAGDESGVNS